jgi:hypothetical protein
MRRVFPEILLPGVQGLRFGIGTVLRATRSAGEANRGKPTLGKRNAGITDSSCGYEAENGNGTASGAGGSETESG